MIEAPTAGSFWIEPGRLLAGTYAGSLSAEGDARESVERLVAAGVTLFVDLTEEGELAPYSSWVAAPAAHRRFAVRDMTVASPEAMAATLDAIDAELARDGVVYVHCWGGCGRTGTVVACWLVRHGAAADAALARFAEVSRDVCGRRCPETEEQRTLVESWSAGR